MRHLPRLLVAALVVAVFAFGYFVFPTPYTYTSGWGESGPVRIHRFSGRAELLSARGWRPLNQQAYDSIQTQRAVESRTPANPFDSIVAAERALAREQAAQRGH